jgi:hypothetical protein
MFEQSLEAIKVVGFPVIVCLWFMLRQDKRLDKINDLLSQISEKLDHKGE